MKLEEFRKMYIEEKYLKKWIMSWPDDTKGKGSWVWNNDGSVDVDGTIFINSNSYPFSKLPVKFRKVKGYFDCGLNSLETLENCPDEIGEDFLFYGNQIESLDFFPKKIGKDVRCYDNPKNFHIDQLNSICKIGGSIVNY